MPVAGANLMEQMLNVEMQAQSNALGLSQKTKTRSKPLAIKRKNDLNKSAKPAMPAKKFGDTAETSKACSSKKTSQVSKVD